MSQLVEIQKDKCELSYACVRACPVNAIEVKANQDHARIIADRCIACGNCIPVCPTEAIAFRSTKEHVKSILKEEKKVAIVAPSISGEFVDITDYRKFVQMIKGLGFDYVLEAAFGADLVADRYKDLFKDFKCKHYALSIK